MVKVILPKLGAHLTERQRRNKPNEILGAPFPFATTTEAILAVADEAERQGYIVVSYEQRPVRLRAPKPGEKAVVVGLTTDQQEGEDPTVYFYRGEKLATGMPSSRLWFVSPDYTFLGSMVALREYWRMHREEQQLNAQIATDVKRQR